MTTEGDGRRSDPVGELVRIYQRGRAWWANYQLAGRQHRRSLGTSSKKEAIRRALKLDAELLAGHENPRPKPPPAAEEVIEEYLQYQRTERRAPKTLAKYTAILARVAALLRDRRAASILGLDLRAVDAYRKGRVDDGAAPKTVYTETVIIRQLVNFAIGRGLIVDDPLRGLKIREPKPSPQPCWTPEEVERILASAPDSLRPTLTILAETGMRVGELCHLTWEDVDLDRNVLHVRPKEGWTPKTGDRRSIPMTPRVRALLLGLPRRGRWALTASPSPRYPRGDHQLSERRLLAGLKRVLAALGLPGHLHTFRHAFISKALTAGVAEAGVRNWVGHVDRDVLQLYTHIASASSQEAMLGLSKSSSIGAQADPSAETGRESDPVQIQHNDTEARNGPAAK